MMARAWLWASVALLLALGGGAAGRIEPTGREARDEELPFFPSGRALRWLELGQPTLLADCAYLTAIQYYGEHRLSDRSYPLARYLFETTTRIDPRFRNAYLFGSLVLAEEAGDLPAARRLLTRGALGLPGDWLLPFHRGFLEYRFGDPDRGAVWMEAASRIPGAPPFTARLAAQACARAGRLDLARALWEEILRGAQEDGLRQLARDRLRELEGATAGSRPGMGGGG